MIALAITLTGAMLGIGALGVAFSGYLVAPLRQWERWYVAAASLFFIAPGLTTMTIGLVALAPIIMLQLGRRQAQPA